MRPAIATALLCCAHAVAANDIDCKAFAAQIDFSQKRLSMLQAELRHASPAARAGINERIAHELALLTVNVSILLKSSCPIPTKPLRANAYSSAASNCLAAVNDAAPQPAACDMSKWQQNPP